MTKLSLRVKPPLARLLLTSVLSLIGVAAVGVPPALAASTIQVAATPTTPIDGTSTGITLTGWSDAGGTVYASLQAGASCGANPANDGGSTVISGDSVAAGPYSDLQTTTPAQGSYLVCAWLMPTGDDGSGTPLAGPVSTALAVSPLSATVTLSAPVSVSYQQPEPVTVSWHANAPGSLFTDVLPASYGPCEATPASEPQYTGWLSGQDGYTNSDAIGSPASDGTNHYLAGEFTPGSYRLCAWIAEASGSVVAGPVSVAFRMLALPGSRTYSGVTSQRLPIALTTTGYSLQDIIYSAKFACGGPEFFATGLRWNGVWNDSVLTAANFGTLRVTQGSFNIRLDANPANRFDLRGSLNGGRLSGSFHALMRVGPPQFKRPAVCRTGEVHFSLSSRRRRRR